MQIRISYTRTLHRSIAIRRCFKLRKMPTPWTSCPILWTKPWRMTLKYASIFEVCGAQRETNREFWLETNDQIGNHGGFHTKIDQNTCAVQRFRIKNLRIDGLAGLVVTCKDYPKATPDKFDECLLGFCSTQWQRCTVLWTNLMSASQWSISPLYHTLVIH